MKTLLTILLTLPFIFGITRTEAFLNEEVTPEEMTTLLNQMNTEEEKNTIGCINKTTLDYVAFDEPKAKSACFIGQGYEAVYYNSNEFWHLKIDLDTNYTDILDLLTIRALECKQADGFCNRSGADFGPFQINKAQHPEEVRRTMEYIYNNDSEGLFDYQAKWTFSDTLYGAKYQEHCHPYVNDPYQLKRYDNDKRKLLSKCRFILHNGNTDIVGGRQFKYIYADAGWVIRENILKPYIKHNEYIGQS